MQLASGRAVKFLGSLVKFKAAIRFIIVRSQTSRREEVNGLPPLSKSGNRIWTSDSLAPIISC